MSHLSDQQQREYRATTAMEHTLDRLSKKFGFCVSSNQSCTDFMVSAKIPRGAQLLATREDKWRVKLVSGELAFFDAYPHVQVVPRRIANLQAQFQPISFKTSGDPYTATLVVGPRSLDRREISTDPDEIAQALLSPTELMVRAFEFAPKRKS